MALRLSEPASVRPLPATAGPPRASRFHHEFWPAWLFYLPLAPYLAYLALRHRGPLAFTAANPGIPVGGGVVGESKSTILAGLHPRHAHLAPPGALIPAGPSPDDRAAAAIRAIAADPQRLHFPVILKPDAGQRGYGVRLARSEGDVQAYFRANPRDVLLQAFHPGPVEVGILWTRDPRSLGPPDARPTRAGSIYAVTRKTFPAVTGDGRRSLRELVLDHPRYAAQARVFLARLADRADAVPHAGETVRLALAGNHCQGTMFTDGSDLITPALEAAIDGVAAAFRGVGPGGLDFARFDLRARSEDDLRAGRLDPGAVVEINGVTSEATSLYDPARSLLWSYSVLFGQWRRLFELGAARRRCGQRPLTLRALRRALRDHYDARPSLELAD